MINHRPALLLCVFAALLFGYILLLKYFSLGYYDWDLAFFTQACHQILQGKQFIPLVGINYFGDHSYFITLFTIPFYILFQSPLTLLLIKLLAFILSGYLIYRYAAVKIGALPSLWVLLLYFCFPANVFGLLYEYNPESLALPLIVCMFIFLEKRQWTHLCIAALLLVLIKENMFLVATVFLGWAAVLAEKKHRNVLLALAALALVVFMILNLYILPMLRGLEHHSFTVRYNQLGGDIWHILLSPILAPGKVSALIWTETNLNFIQTLFSVLLLPVLFAPMALLPMLPLLLQHCLSQHGPEHTIFYHYGPTMAVFIFIAFIQALNRIKDLKLFRPLLMVFVVMACLVNFMIWNNQLAVRWNIFKMEQAPVYWDMLKQIPSDKGVIATFEFLAPLSTREHLYSFHMIYDDQYQDKDRMLKSELYTGKIFELPPDVGYALINFKDAWYQEAKKRNPHVTQQRVQAFLKDFRPVKKAGPVVLLERYK